MENVPIEEEEMLEEIK